MKNINLKQRMLISDLILKFPIRPYSINFFFCFKENASKNPFVKIILKMHVLGFFLLLLCLYFCNYFSLHLCAFPWYRRYSSLGNIIQEGNINSLLKTNVSLQNISNHESCSELSGSTWVKFFITTVKC